MNDPIALFRDESKPSDSLPQSGPTERIERVNLVASAGLSEAWWACPSVTAPVRKTLLALLRVSGLDRAPVLRTIAGHLQLISTTPT